MSSDTTNTDPARLAEELAREKEEVRRLRETLVLRDRELGAARGRLSEIEARARLLLDPLRRLRGLPAAFDRRRGTRS